MTNAFISTAELEAMERRRKDMVRKDAVRQYNREKNKKPGIKSAGAATSSRLVLEVKNAEAAHKAKMAKAAAPAVNSSLYAIIVAETNTMARVVTTSGDYAFLKAVRASDYAEPAGFPLVRVALKSLLIFENVADAKEYAAENGLSLSGDGDSESFISIADRLRKKLEGLV